jgi:ABC-type sugar transport system ATPase subunit
MAEVAFVNVEKHYGPVKVISGLNLKIADGEFAVLVAIGLRQDHIAADGRGP